MSYLLLAGGGMHLVLYLVAATAGEELSDKSLTETFALRRVSIAAFHGLYAM